MFRDPLNEIGDQTPHVFRLHVSPGSGTEAAAALTRLEDRSEIELNRDGDVLTVSSTFSPRSAAVLRPLNVLDRAGVKVLGCELVDCIENLSPRRIRNAVESWRSGGDAGRRRVEKLAGDAILRQLFEGFDHSDDRRRSDWAFAIGRASFNTDGSETTLLDAATSMSTHRAHTLITAVDDRAQLCALSQGRFRPPFDAIVELIDLGGYNAELTVRILSWVPKPLPTEFVDLLVRLAEGPETLAAVAIPVLVGAPENGHVDALMYELLSDEERASSVRAAALSALAERRGLDAASPYWRAFLASRSANLRWAAESALARHGSIDHIDAGATQLAKIIRRKSSVSYHPPRGSAMLNFVASHSDHPDAARALEDVAARWDRLEPDLRDWIVEKHPWIEPSTRATVPMELVVEAEPPVRHPPPSLEATSEGAISIGFWETDMHEVREPFEDLLSQEAGIEIRSSAREFIEIVTVRDDLARLVTRLWEQAHES